MTIGYRISRLAACAIGFLIGAWFVTIGLATLVSVAHVDHSPDSPFLGGLQLVGGAALALRSAYVLGWVGRATMAAQRRFTRAL